MSDKLIDWRGNEIKVGSTIIYAVSHGNGVELNEAIVKKIEDNPGYDSRYRPYRLWAQPVNSHHKSRFKEWKRDDETGKYVSKAKEANLVRLTALERVAVIG